MTPNPDAERPLIRVTRPAVRGTLRMEPVTVPDGPVTDGPLIHVRRPAIRGKLTFGPVPPVFLELTANLRADADAGAVLGALGRLVKVMSGYEELLPGGAGLRADETRSGVRPGPAVSLVLVPNNPDGAADRLRAVAALLAVGVRGAVTGWDAAVVRLVSPDDPGGALFEVAA